MDQIALQARRVRVKIAKTDRIASLEISTVVVAELANLPRKAGPLFTWTTRNAVYAWLKPVRKRAGVHCTPHLSRHALATAAIAACPTSARPSWAPGSTRAACSATSTSVRMRSRDGMRGY